MGCYTVVMAQCSIDGCEKSVVGRGWCRTHYMRWKRWGDPNAHDHRTGKGRTPCSVDDCEKPVASGGLCTTHSRQMERAADPNVGPFPRDCGYCGESFLSRYATRSTFCSRKCKEQARHQTPEFKAENLRRYYMRRYGMTPEEAAEMRKRGCDICGRSEVPGRWVGNMHIDHDHDTGRVRGVLCHGCNVSIGHFKHDPALLRKAADYLAS